MKTLKTLIVALLISASAFAQSVGINSDGSSPDGSAMLDVKSTSKGFLAPRVSSTGDITSPATGLLVYQTGGTPGYYYNSGTPASPAWVQLGAASGASQWTTTGSNIYYNTGNVGIGTSTASSNLTVNGATHSQIQLQSAGLTKGYFWWQSEGYLAVGPGSANNSVIFKDNNVGIGTAIPAYKLHVAGDVNFTGALRVNAAAGTAGQVLTSNGTSAPAWSSISATNVTGTVAVANGGTGTTNGSITGTGALTFAAGGTNKNVTITPSGTGYTLLGGNVGIGQYGTGTRLNIADVSTTASSSALYITKTGAISGSAYGINAIMSGASESYAVRGTSTGTGTSNYGVYGLSIGAATNNIGVLGYANNGATNNYGVYGWVDGSTGTNSVGGIFFNVSTAAITKYGCYSEAYGANGTNIGGYFSAHGATTNYGLIVEEGKVGIGTITPSHPLQMASGAHVTTAGVWTNASDARLKTNIVNTPYGLSTVMKLRPVNYTMVKGGEAQVGFLAQEVQKIVPEVVSGTEGDITKGETLGLSYGNLVPVLTKAIQEQQSEIEALKAKLSALDNLKAENSSLKAENNSIKADVEALKSAVYGTAQIKQQ